MSRSVEKLLFRREKPYCYESEMLDQQLPLKRKAEVYKYRLSTIDELKKAAIHQEIATIPLDMTR